MPSQVKRALPRFQVFQHRQMWYVRFSCECRQFKLCVGRIEEIEAGKEAVAARAVVENAVFQLRAARAEREIHCPLAQYRRHIANRSISHKENCLRFEARFRDFFRDRDLQTICRADVERWRDWLLDSASRKDEGKGARGLSKKTVKEHIDWLAAVFTNADWVNPCRRVERPKKSHADRAETLEYFSPGEMDRLFSVSGQIAPSARNGFIVLAYTGCRVDEIQSLRPEHIDFQNQVVSVIGKGRVLRPLKLSGPIQPAWDALMDELRESRRADGYIFPQYETWAGKFMDRLCLLAFGATDAQGKAIDDVSKLRHGKAVRRGHPHMLRHTMASLALQHFEPRWEIAFLAKWLGHKNINTTYQIYGHMIATQPVSSYPAESSRTILEPLLKTNS